MVRITASPTMYEELRVEAEQKGWRARVYPVEMGCRGYVWRSVISLLGEVGVGGNKKLNVKLLRKCQKKQEKLASGLE